MLFLIGRQLLRDRLYEVISCQCVLPAATQDFPEALSPLLVLPTLAKLRCMLDSGYFPHFADEETEISVIKSFPTVHS